MPKIHSLTEQRQRKHEATERTNLVNQIRWLMGDLECYLSETLAADFTAAGGWRSGDRTLSLEELRVVEAKLRGVEAELAALREET
jgi:hypothetical protein